MTIVADDKFFHGDCRLFLLPIGEDVIIVMDKVIHSLLQLFRYSFLYVLYLCDQFCVDFAAEV